MTVDTSRLKRRKGLGAPPTEGTPGLEPEPAPQSQTVDGSDMAALPNADAASTATASEGNGGGSTQRIQSASTHQTQTESAAFDIVPTLSNSARHRVPPVKEESKVPFTTRVTVSTKERLENACYHLRRRHQEFVNDAIAAHLEKHGF